MFPETNRNRGKRLDKHTELGVAVHLLKNTTVIEGAVLCVNSHHFEWYRASLFQFLYGVTIAPRAVLVFERGAFSLRQGK